MERMLVACSINVRGTWGLKLIIVPPARPTQTKLAQPLEQITWDIMNIEETVLSSRRQYASFASLLILQQDDSAAH